MEDKIRGYGGQDIVLLDEIRRVIVELVNGDARRALNTLEMMADMVEVDDSGKRVLKFELLIEIVGERSVRFDNKGDRFYDLIFVLYKSVRGSVFDAALYWYARIIIVGGDSLYVARRCLAIAFEDVGNVDLRAMQVVIAVWDCFIRVGSAEGERVIVQAIVYLVCALKSNVVYIAFKVALVDVRERSDYDVSVYLRNASTKLMKEMGYGQEYRYVYDEVNVYVVGEVYFSSEIV